MVSDSQVRAHVALSACTLSHKAMLADWLARHSVIDNHGTVLRHHHSGQAFAGRCCYHCSVLCWWQCLCSSAGHSGLQHQLLLDMCPSQGKRPQHWKINLNLNKSVISGMMHGVM